MSYFTVTGLTPDVFVYALESSGIPPQSGRLLLKSNEIRVYPLQADDGQRMEVAFYRSARCSNAQIRQERPHSSGKWAP